MQTCWVYNVKSYGFHTSKLKTICQFLIKAFWLIDNSKSRVSSVQDWLQIAAEATCLPYFKNRLPWANNCLLFQGVSAFSGKYPWGSKPHFDAYLRPIVLDIKLNYFVLKNPSRKFTMFNIIQLPFSGLRVSCTAPWGNTYTVFWISVLKQRLNERRKNIFIWVCKAKLRISNLFLWKKDLEFIRNFVKSFLRFKRLSVHSCCCKNPHLRMSCSPNTSIAHTCTWYRSFEYQIFRLI